MGNPFPPVGGVNNFKGVDAFKIIHEAPHTVMVFTAFDVVDFFVDLLFCLCAVLFGTVLFVRFYVTLI